jgi:superfamily I DNA and/or RNA helicase
MDRGDRVRVSFSTGEKAFGVLERVETQGVRVAVDGPLPEKIPAGRLSIDVLGSEATWRRMRRAVGEIASAEGNWPARLRAVIDGTAEPATRGEAEVDFLDPDLDEWQRLAVRRALGAQDAALIHGPPGTGKTTALVEVIRQAARSGLRVLAGAPSNIAVDNILERLLPDMDRGLRVVRLGHPARTLEPLRRATLGALASGDPQAEEVRAWRAERERTLKRLSREGRRALAGPERGRALAQARFLEREIRSAEAEAERRLLLSAQVVLSTHGGISRRFLPGTFDLAALDEASQAVEPLSWIPLLRARKAVLAGDSKQLPPTIRSPEAAPELGVTLFDRLQGRLPETMQTLLREQYRMNERLMEFPSHEFYSGSLLAHPSVKDQLALGLEGVKETDLTAHPLVFIDTAGTGWEESFDEALQSRENPGEARLAMKILGELLEAGMRPRDLGLLSPYLAQVRALRTLAPEGVEAGTVDGFQGREKEAVLVSLVRSNERGSVGFLGEVRRMNVAITRARRLLVLIGDSATLCRHPFYRRLVEFVELRGSRRSAWEWA